MKRAKLTDKMINLVPRVFVPLNQRSENESSGSNHFEITNEITEFCPFGFTQSAPIWRACLKWLLPELAFLPQARRIVGSADENDKMIRRNKKEE